MRQYTHKARPDPVEKCLILKQTGEHASVAADRVALQKKPKKKPVLVVTSHGSTSVPLTCKLANALTAHVDTNIYNLVRSCHCTLWIVCKSANGLKGNWATVQYVCMRAYVYDRSMVTNSPSLPLETQC